MSKKVEAKKDASPVAKEESKPKPTSAAPKTEKKQKKEQKGVYSIYKVEGEKFTRQRPTCERCGPGYFMADHHDRFTCGHCGFTRYKRA